MAVAIGIDLGGTKIEGVVVDSASPTTPIAKHRIPTDSHLGAQHIFESVQKLVAELISETRRSITGVGIAHPGTIEPSTNLLKNAPNTAVLQGLPILAELEARLRIPVEGANDANCFALAEATYGAAAGSKNVFGVILGTGCGGGIVINGSIVGGAQGIGGEWGHNILSDDGPIDPEGRQGTVEGYIAGPAVEKFYRELTGVALRVPQIESRVATDAAAALTLERLYKCFGKSIATVINILDPEYIVVGGGLSHIDGLYTAGVDAARHWVFNNRLETKIVRNQLGDSAGVFGAASLIFARSA